MEDWFNECPTINLLMMIVSVLAIITFVHDGNWHAVVWAVNTLLWVIIASDYEIDCKNRQ